MGWNSFDCYGETVTCDELLAHADFMARELESSGWDTLVIDAGWSVDCGPAGWGFGREENVLDAWGRPVPHPAKYPEGFGPLVAALRRLGLKFGIHALRGIPREAVRRRLPVQGTHSTADQVADTSSTCTWSDRMYGMNPDHPDAQAYVDSLAELWAEWGVDYVKMDDIASPYHEREIEMVSQALARCGRPVVLSLSPGNATPLAHVDHLKKHAHLWRISPDFWDKWVDLRSSFDLLAQWSAHSGPGGWADADMLPIGQLATRGHGPDNPPRWSRFTWEEEQTMFVLWCIARSPLMLGGVLPTLPARSLALVTHPELIALNQRGAGAREVSRSDRVIVWRSEVDGVEYQAWFNVSDEPVRAELGLGRQVVLGEQPISSHGVLLTRAG